LIVQRLMVPFFVIMNYALPDGASQHVLAEKEHPIQAVFFDGSYKALGIRVQIR
jgi:hypothetical protein